VSYSALELSNGNQLFVAVLGASNYTYAEATWTQGLSDWIDAHTRTFAFFWFSTRCHEGITKGGLGEVAFYSRFFVNDVR
jgi:hypothetical protein